MHTRTVSSLEKSDASLHKSSRIQLWQISTSCKPNTGRRIADSQINKHGCKLSKEMFRFPFLRPSRAYFVVWECGVFIFKQSHAFIFVVNLALQSGNKLGEGEREQALISSLQSLCKEHDRETARQAIETLLTLAK